MTSIVLVRKIRARPSLVFDALTNPDGISHWRGPDAGPVLLAETEPRVDGRFRVRFRSSTAVNMNAAANISRWKSPGGWQ
jgi:uncharacterized protein YndB with AHSA1/START domain